MFSSVYFSKLILIKIFSVEWNNMTLNLKEIKIVDDSSVTFVSTASIQF
jgi:hypothetical protein